MTSACFAARADPDDGRAGERVAGEDAEALARGFALRALGRRLHASGIRPRGALADLVRIVAAELEAMRDAEAEALRCYRGRGSTAGGDAWLFLIADLHAEARRLFAELAAS